MASTIKCSIVNIGEKPIITLTFDAAGANQNTKSHSLTWYVKGHPEKNGVISRDRLALHGSISNFAWPLSLYEECPEKRYVDIVLMYELFSCDVNTCGFGPEHYDEHILERVTLYTQANVNISSSTPTISLPTVVDTKAATKALTGDASKLIRYASTAKLTANIEARNGAYIEADATTVHCGGVTKPYVSGATFESVAGKTFEVSARDSRGLSTRITYELPAERFIEYFPPTCNIGNDRPNTDGTMKVTCSGNYFNGSFGAQNNTLSVQYRYKVQGGTFGTWTNMTASISGNKYTASANLTGLDYQKTYVFECRATDKVATATTAENATQAMPAFHWGKDDFVHETVVDFRAGIKANGVDSDLVVAQGSNGTWAYRKWASGRAECWGVFIKNVTSSDWTEWGSLYQAEVVANQSYPFEFTAVPHEQATLWSTSGGLLDCTEWGLTAKQTGTYYAVHPKKLPSTYGFRLELYVCGYWK